MSPTPHRHRPPARLALTMSLLIVLATLWPAAGAWAQEATPSASPAADAGASPTAGTASVTLAADGVPNPRGMVWDESGAMIVASGGIGGTEPLPADESGAIFRITNGCPVTLASGFPSASAFGSRYGISDVAWLKGSLYALGDGGFDVTPPTPAPDGVFRINADGTWESIVNLGAWVENNPTKVVPGDADPGGEPYAMVSDGEALWVAESNRGQILRVTPAGEISRVADLSDPHEVPTGLALAPDGGVYVGFLTPAPYLNGTSRVIKVTADGTVTEVWRGLTMLTAVAVAPDGTLYALEMSTDNTLTPPFVGRDRGRVVRQTGPDSLEPVLTGLMQPVRMSFGPDGGLFVAFPAHDANVAPGAILRIDPAAINQPLPTDLRGTGNCAAPVMAGAPPATSAPLTVPAPAGTASAAPAATVTAATVTGPDGSGAITIDISISITLDQPGQPGQPSQPVTVPVRVGSVVTPAAPAPPAGAEAPPAATPATASPPPSAAPVVATGPITIEIKNYAFNPPVVQVSPGTTVTWVNHDTVAHTATANTNAFNSGNLNPGQSYSYTFTAADAGQTLAYACLYHPSMLGQIIVT